MEAPVSDTIVLDTPGGPDATAKNEEDTLEAELAAAKAQVVAQLAGLADEEEVLHGPHDLLQSCPLSRRCDTRIDAVDSDDADGSTLVPALPSAIPDRRLSSLPRLALRNAG